MEQKQEQKQELKKNLGAVTAMATVVGSVIGSGVFVKTPGYLFSDRRRSWTWNACLADYRNCKYRSSIDIFRSCDHDSEEQVES